MKMMMMSHTKALTVAQPQPSASSSPNRARRRGTAVPGPSACWAIVLPPHPPSTAATSLYGERPRHRRMHGADERVGAGRECLDREIAGGDPGEGIGLEHDRAGRVLEREVVRRPGVLVV